MCSRHSLLTKCGLNQRPFHNAELFLEDMDMDMDMDAASHDGLDGKEWLLRVLDLQVQQKASPSESLNIFIFIRISQYLANCKLEFNRRGGATTTPMVSH